MSTELELLQALGDKVQPYQGFERGETLGNGVGKSELMAMYHPRQPAQSKKLRSRRAYVTRHDMAYIFDPRPTFNRVHVLPEKPEITLRDIMRAVSRVTCINIADLMSRRRFLPLARARFVFFWMARQYTSHSLPSIAHFISMDHTSVLHGVQIVTRDWLAYENLVDDAKSALAELLEAKNQ